jgi:hypothetical protein
MAESENTFGVTINVIDIYKGCLIGKIHAPNDNNIGLSSAKFVKIINEINYVYYDEAQHKIYTGHDDGSFIIWF